MLRGMTTTFEIPTLRTERLVLRAFRPSDLDAWAAMEADPDVRRYRGNNPRTRNEVWRAMEVSLGQWALRGYGLFALELASNTTFAGFAGICPPPSGRKRSLPITDAKSVGQRPRRRSSSRGA